MTENRRAFVVTETSFEYNDEVHSVGDVEGGTPLVVYESRDDARQHIKQLTVDWLREQCRLTDYGYETSSIYSRKPSFLSMEGVVDEEAHQNEAFFAMDSYEVDNLIGFTGSYSERGLKDRSQEELEELASCLAFMPYFVTEVPLGSPV